MLSSKLLTILSMNLKKTVYSLLILLAGLAACNKSTQPNTNNLIIKNYATYDADWKAVEKMEQKGLGNSVVSKVDSILFKALAEENSAQIFKALAYRSKYYHQLIEESSLKIFNQYEEHIANATFPLKQILHSAAAELYYQYYQANRWEFQSRTTTQNFNKQDIRTWSLDDILAQVDQHYQQSLTQQEDLLAYPIENLSAILHQPDLKKELSQFDGKYLQPTLYDFLANRALQYYQQNEGRVNSPQVEFQADDYSIFSKLEDFVAIPFSTTDSASNDFKTAILYQQLIRSHQNDEELSALLHLELSRLRHYYTTSKKEAKDSLYLMALNHVARNFSTSKNAAEIQYAVAKFYFDKGNDYTEEEGDKNRWYYKKAHSLCSAVGNDESYGAIQCKVLKEQIERKSLALYAENVYLPSAEIQYKIAATNIDSVYFKLIKIPNTIEEHKKQFTSIEDYIKQLLKTESKREWTKQLTNPRDYREHSYSFATNSLEKGKYILVCSTNKNFSKSTAITNYVEFQVSELSFISKNENKGTVDFYALHRMSGEKISGVNLNAYYYDYNYQISKNQLKIFGAYVTDKNGFVQIPAEQNQRNFTVALSLESDTLNDGGSFYSRNYPIKETKRIQTLLFSDRAIYRPGQTVYFKGIVVERGRKTNEILPNRTSEVRLLNVNGELVAKLDVKTNDYGSYQGSFTLPSSGLNGTYRLQTDGGNHNIQVEEYKRPTFEVLLDSSKGSEKINQNIHVQGNVVGYSGAKISNAKVTYRVRRRTSFPWWGYWWRPMPKTGDKEIVNGELIANENGAFEFDFFAAADEQVALNWNPNYNFEITLDATSPSGETQSLNETITLGTKEVYLSSNLTKSLQINELKKLVVSAKNIHGTALAQKLNFKLYRLKIPTTIEKESYWKSSEYLENTVQPTKTTNINEFERGPELLQGVIESNKTSNLIGNLPVGAYEIEVTTMTEEKSEYLHRFELFDENSKQLAIPSTFEFKAIKMNAEPGEEASFLIGSSLANLKLLYEIHVDGKRISQRWITLNKEQRKITLPIKESYRGGVQVNYIGIYNNRTIKHEHQITVPYTNKNLQLTLGTYRNKVQPGCKEKWNMTITGSMGEKVSSELLVGMYDQSLDQFKTHDWKLALYNNNRNSSSWIPDRLFTVVQASTYGYRNEYSSSPQRIFPSLNWFGFSLTGYNRRMYVDGITLSMQKSVAYEFEAEPMMMEDSDSETAMSSNTKRGQSKQLAIENQPNKKNNQTTNPIRSDFRETAFFYPQLRTDQNGTVSFEFEMPDALTKWKLRALAHTKDLKVGTTETSIQTQKELMVSPTVPRFFREGDALNLKVMVSNLSGKPQNGIAKIRFFDAFTNQAINIADGLAADQKFNLFPAGNAALEWKVRIPKGVQAIKYQVTAASESFSDGEEKVIPVLPNRKLVTESLPLAIRGNQQKQFVFEKLANNTSKTLTHESYTLEFASNPAWYAVQALPYVVESTSECSEQIFARLYANLLAQKIALSNPRIREVFELWKNADSKELTSKLMQNQELKSILIEETPWLQQAKSETEQKKRIALLFDLNKIASEKTAALKRLEELQLPNGGWAWYKGMHDNRYITQYIIEGLGHLKYLGVDLSDEPEIKMLLSKGIDYLDNRIVEDYNWLQKHGKDLSKNQLNQTQIHYLYTRSFFLEKEFSKNSKAFNYYLKQAEKYWLESNLYLKGMQALAIHRLNPSSNVPKTIVASLKDNALQSEQMGMYWKENQPGYYWYNSPIETQALMIEVFHEVIKDKNAVDELRVWLLKEKQTQLWSNSKATALACYALLIDNVKDLTDSGQNLTIKVGKNEVKPTSEEAGTGYFKKVWTKNEIQPELGAIVINKASEGIAWGAAYWQYYEDLDKITNANVEEFSVSKTLFKVIVDEKGEKMIPVDASGISIGDKIRVRLRIESKRNLEFIHIKDMRASGFEPINVISRYKHQDGLGNYESTKDASTNFFMDQLNKGIYVFEYDLRATVSGEFSNGICTLQCQYAPEFTTHSKGKRLSIKN